MNTLGKYFFSGSGFTDQQNRTFLRRNFLSNDDCSLKSFAMSDYMFKGISGKAGRRGSRLKGLKCFFNFLHFFFVGFYNFGSLFKGHCPDNLIPMFNWMGSIGRRNQNPICRTKMVHTIYNRSTIPESGKSGADVFINRKQVKQMAAIYIKTWWNL